MDIDIILEPDLTPTEIKELGIVAENYGIRALWTSNYFSHWDGFLSLVPLAQSTKQLKFGPLALSPLEMHPLLGPFGPIEAIAPIWAHLAHWVH